MAACSEQQIDGNVATDLHSKFPVSAANIQNSEVPVKSLKTSERILVQKVNNSGVEEPDYSSLQEEELRNLLEDLTSHHPKDSSLLAQRLLDGVRDTDDSPSASHGVFSSGGKAYASAFNTLRGPARRRTPISSHRSLQDLPALQQDAMRSAGLGRSRPSGGRAVRAHSLSDHQDFDGDTGHEVAIEMVPLTRKSVDQESTARRSDDNLDRAGAKNGVLTSEEDRADDEDYRAKNCSLVLTKLFPFSLQHMDPMDRERTKAFLSGSDIHMARTNNYQDFGAHNSHTMLRKGKKARASATEDKLFAKNIEGNCGDLPIERLLEFIYSGDKQRSKTSNNNLGAKVKNSNSSTRKFLPKAGNNSTSRNKDDLAEDLVNNNYVESRNSLVRGDKQESAAQDEPALPSGGTPERSLSPSFYSDQGMDGDGSYRVDVSSFSDVDQIHEECEFRVVTKKHRRKMQPKKGCMDNFRQAPYYQPVPLFKNKNSNPSDEERPEVTGRPPRQASEMMRRKSAGSAPHSDQSSPENSDLESVHSLPVDNRGSRAASAASTLQTSYADIARMSCARRERNFYSQGGEPADAPMSLTGDSPVPSSATEDATVVPSLVNDQPASQAVDFVRSAAGDSSASSTGGDAELLNSTKQTTSSSSSSVYAECPAVVIMDGQEGLESALSLGEITFGFDVNEQLLRMTLEDVFVPSVERREVATPSAIEQGRGQSKQASPKAVPRFEGPSDDVGRFNYRDVVDFLDCAWNRAYQSYERDMANGEKKDDGCLRTLYYCDATGQQRS